MAYWLDFVFLALLLLGLQWFLYKVTSGFPFLYFRKGYEIEIWVLVSMSFPVWLYFMYYELYQQQTIGKRLLRLIVTNQNGTKIRIHQALIRTFIRLLPWELTHIILLIPIPWWSIEKPQNLYLIYVPNLIMLVYIGVLFATKGEKGVHDYIAKTSVIGR